MIEQSLFTQIREFVKKIPKGKVLTYGDVARALGICDARKVGWALHGNTDKSIPCHRVVKKNGFLALSYKSSRDKFLLSEGLSKKLNFKGANEQKQLLIKEGVVFVGEYQVDMSSCHWER